MKQRFGTLAAIGGATVVLTSALAAAQPPRDESAAAVPRAGAVMVKRVPVQVEAPVVLDRIGRLDALTEQYRPYLRVEYHFLRRVCALSQDERKLIARESERAYAEAMALYEEARRPGELRRPGEQPRVLPEPRMLIEESLARVVDKHLSPERAARYRAERAKRAAERKRVTIRGAIERLDQIVCLSPTQRTRLAESLNSLWDDAWFPTESMTMDLDQYLRRIPASRFIPLLDPDQITLWRQEMSRPSTVVTVSSTLQAIPRDFPEDEELAEARKAEGNLAEVSP